MSSKRRASRRKSSEIDSELDMSNSKNLTKNTDYRNKLEDLTVLKRSPDLLNNVKKRSRSTTAYNETYFVLWRLQPFWLSDQKQSNEYSIK